MVNSLNCVRKMMENTRQLKMKRFAGGRVLQQARQVHSEKDALLVLFSGSCAFKKHTPSPCALAAPETPPPKNLKKRHTHTHTEPQNPRTPEPQNPRTPEPQNPRTPEPQNPRTPPSPSKKNKQTHSEALP